MAEQIRKLEAFFKRRESDPDADEGDDNTFGEYWEFQDPDEVEKWSMALNPMTGWAHFVHKFKTASAFLPISYDEHIKDVLYEKPSTVLVHCKTLDDDPYMFTICLDNKKSPFDLTEFLTTLQDSPYDKLLKELEEQVDKKEWVNKNGLPLSAAGMASKVRQTLVSLDVVTARNRGIADRMKAIELTGQLASQAGSIGTQGAASTRSRVVVPSTSKRNKAGDLPSQSKRMKVARPAEVSIGSALTEIPKDLEPGETTDYTETKTNYEKFWSECQECFIFDVDKKFSLHISQLHRAPTDWTIREYEEAGMQRTLHFLCQMPDPSVKQTLCVMPDTQEKPTDWEAIKDGKFFIINGQHSVAASKKMQATELPENIVKHFLNWNCFIVWSKDKNRLRQISGYYNRCNHLGVFKPTWATNVLGARFIWTELGRPRPPKGATEIGRVVKRTRKDAENDSKYKVHDSIPPRSI